MSPVSLLYCIMNTDFSEILLIWHAAFSIKGAYLDAELKKVTGRVLGEAL